MSGRRSQSLEPESRTKTRQEMDRRPQRLVTETGSETKTKVPATSGQGSAAKPESESSVSEISPAYKVVRGRYVESDSDDDKTDRDVQEISEEIADENTGVVQPVEQEGAMEEEMAAEGPGETPAVASALEMKVVEDVQEMTPEAQRQEEEENRKIQEEFGTYVKLLRRPEPLASPTSSTSVEQPRRACLAGCTKKCCFPMGMKLRCLEGSATSSAYSLLENFGAEHSSSDSSKDSTTEKQEELQFFTDSGSSSSVIVEKNLRAIDLCQLLAVKNRVPKDYTWCIVEHWIEFGIERVLEDHEDVLSVYRQTENGAKKLLFRRYPSKYDFFLKPEDYFPAAMVDLGRVSNEPISSEDTVYYSNENPLIFSQVHIQKRHDKHIWVRTFVLLKDKKILMSLNVHAVSKFLRKWKNRSSRYSPLEEQVDPNRDDYDPRKGLQFLADLSDYEVYTILNAKNQLKAPTEFGVCLRRTCEEDFSSALFFSCESENDRICWVTAMRLAKYGKQLKENFREFRNKQRSVDPDDMTGFGTASENLIARVPMDFTGSVGRIVEDPTEARAIAVAEASGSGGKQRLRSSAAAAAAAAVVAGNVVASRSSTTTSTDFESLDRKHANKPWFHKTMTREQACKALSDDALEIGTFVIRDSRSQPGCYVLSVKLPDRVVHWRIYPMIDNVNLEACYSLDNGTTKFYTLAKLVEFYRLNQGSLPSRLTCFLEKEPPL